MNTETKSKTKAIRGMTFMRFRAPDQPRPMWNWMLHGKIRASYCTLRECQEAAKCIR